MEADDRRKHRRLGHDARVTVRALTFPLEESRPVEVEMCDVSPGGVRVLTPVMLPEGQPVEVCITLPGWYKHTHDHSRYREMDKPLTAVGKVLRCQDWSGEGLEAAIEFTDIWEDHWKAMRLYLEELFSGGEK